MQTLCLSFLFAALYIQGESKKKKKAGRGAWGATQRLSATITGQCIWAQYWLCFSDIRWSIPISWKPDWFERQSGWRLHFAADGDFSFELSNSSHRSLMNVSEYGKGSVATGDKNPTQTNVTEFDKQTLPGDKNHKAMGEAASSVY